MKISWTFGLSHYSRAFVYSQMTSSSKPSNGNMSGYVLKLRGLGRLRGVVEKNVDGGSYLAFKGVPYAKPPLEKLRFADPVPPEPWTGIREAVNFGNSCAQYDIISRKYLGSEDCLYLNVYVPSIEEKNRPKKFPVMVWIHGGGFVFGSGDNFTYGPDYLLKKDVIIVTINYRLGVLGFLNLEHRVAPGNQGLKDQVAALRWVQEHIEVFGGDKSNVTIFGESAGAASVHYLTLSPLAEGLFHKAISISGTGFCPWASVLMNPKNYALRLLEYLGARFSDEKEIIDFLRTVDCDKLKAAENNLQTPQEKMHLNFLFGPGPDDVADQPFLPNFVSSIKNGVVKVPLILGYNNAEGLIFINRFNEKNCEAMNTDFGWFLHPQALTFVERDNNLTPTDVKRIYLGDGPVDPEKSLMKLIEMIGDVYFANGVHELAQAQARKSKQPTYLYKYSYDQGFSLLKTALNSTHVPGACHADELIYFFYPHGLSEFGIEPPKEGSKDRIVIERFTQMWTDFAKTGNPIPAESKFVKTSWKAVKEANELHYLEINEELSPGLNPDAARRLQWNKLCNKL